LPRTATGKWLSMLESPHKQNTTCVRAGARWLRTQSGLLLFVCFLLAIPQPASGYAVYTHAELIDLLWLDSIRPFLLHRYPGTTAEELDEAHAYAYGGCVIQDLGYYPFGKQIFSDLTHYVRTGDFIHEMFRNARNVDELAFAVGALSHYVGDIVGHSKSVNPATGITFPELARKYGPVVTYEDAKVAHGQTEFGFDAVQVGLHRYAPHAYRQYIGFEVSQPLLRKAFYETYGLTVRSVLGPQPPAIRSYRTSVRKILPRFIQWEIINIRSDFPKESQDPSRQQFLQDISRTEYARSWRNSYRQPGVGAHIVAFIIRLIPKIGVLKILSIKAPTTETEDLFFQSVNTAADTLRGLLRRLADNPTKALDLADRDLDTGERIKPGAYRLTDQTYAELLRKITARPNMPIPAGLRDDILAYYADPNAPISTKQDKKAWAKVQAELDVLKRVVLANGNRE
jgi:hypothetical protein